MSAQPIIKDNLEALDSGARLLQLLSDEQYNRVYSPYFSSSIGKHFRHILDHYLSFISGLNNCHVNYDQRDRDERLENDPGYALKIVNQIKDALIRINGEQQSSYPLDRSINVTLCTSTGPDTPPAGSTLQRELVFLQGHTTHHYAIIAAILKLLNIPVDERFGVAPSTLKYEEQSQCAQ